MWFRCDSCHGYAEKLLNSAREMEDSIALNLRYARAFQVSLAVTIDNVIFISQLINELLSLSSHAFFDLLIDIQVATQESVFRFGFITRLESTITGFKFHKLKTRKISLPGPPF
jgi:hypothetical protein